MIPQDPAILFSYINTWLRDHEGDARRFLTAMNWMRPAGRIWRGV